MTVARRIIAGAILVVVLGLGVWALVERAGRTSSSARTDELRRQFSEQTAEIGRLRREVAGLRDDGAAERGALAFQIAVLQHQIRELGGDPVIDDGSSGSSTPPGTNASPSTPLPPCRVSHPITGVCLVR